MGAGLWTEQDILGAQVAEVAAQWTPGLDEETRAKRYAGWCDAIDRSLNLAAL